jgi:ribonuclease R
LRCDLTDEFVVTIDPADAKDHDDAVSLRRDDDGNFLLGVHIADVSRYVPEKSAIDKEARARCFSVYLQHHHLPMLPPKLPGEVCSLKPGRDRLALSVLIHLDRDGKVLKQEIVASKVRIQRLISYETAQRHIDKADSSDPELTSQLRLMWRLAKALKAHRLSEGGVDFDLPEADFHWNGGASPERIFREVRLDSHQLIEEFMLAANRAVAEIWGEKYGPKAPSVFRVHEPPDAEKRQKLSDYLADAGFDWPAEKLTTAAHLKAMLDEAHRRFPIEVTSIIARKALMLARYDSTSRGHFGLGFKRYLHFTSPIRRYSDLTVHRLIWNYLIYNQPDENRNELKSELEAVIEQINDRERLIAELERESIKLATLLYLKEHQDQIFDACVVEEANDRIYVALEDLFIEGYIAEDYGIQFKSRRHTHKKYQRNRGTGSALSIGDKLQVSVSHIDLLSRKLELLPV